MQRRQFLGSVGLAALSVPAAFKAGALESSSLIKPPRLAPGDKIALVNPATAAFETMPIEILAESLEAMGLVVVKSENYFDRRGYFAGGDQIVPTPSIVFLPTDRLKHSSPAAAGARAGCLPCSTTISFDKIPRSSWATAT